VEEAGIMAVAEAAEGNNNERESNVAMMTVADNISNSNSGSGGDNGGGCDSNGGKKITINYVRSCYSVTQVSCRHTQCASDRWQLVGDLGFHGKKVCIF
jgi:hypothetical protein